MGIIISSNENSLGIDIKELTGCRKDLYGSKNFCNIFWFQNVLWVLHYPVKHILYFFDARMGSGIDLFSAGSDIYVVNFELFVFMEGVIFRRVHGNIKVVVW